MVDSSTDMVEYTTSSLGGYTCNNCTISSAVHKVDRPDACEA